MVCRTTAKLSKLMTALPLNDNAFSSFATWFRRKNNGITDSKFNERISTINKSQIISRLDWLNINSFSKVMKNNRKMYKVNGSLSVDTPYKNSQVAEASNVIPQNINKKSDNFFAEKRGKVMGRLFSLEIFVVFSD